MRVHLFDPDSVRMIDGVSLIVCILVARLFSPFFIISGTIGFFFQLLVQLPPVTYVLSV